MKKLTFVFLILLAFTCAFLFASCDNADNPDNIDANDTSGSTAPTSGTTPTSPNTPNATPESPTEPPLVPMELPDMPNFSELLDMEYIGRLDDHMEYYGEIIVRAAPTFQEDYKEAIERYGKYFLGEIPEYVFKYAICLGMDSPAHGYYITGVTNEAFDSFNEYLILNRKPLLNNGFGIGLSHGQMGGLINYLLDEELSVGIEARSIWDNRVLPPDDVSFIINKYLILKGEEPITEDNLGYNIVGITYEALTLVNDYLKSIGEEPLTNDNAGNIGAFGIAVRLMYGSNPNEEWLRKNGYDDVVVSLSSLKEAFICTCFGSDRDSGDSRPEGINGDSIFSELLDLSNNPEHWLNR